MASICLSVQHTTHLTTHEVATLIHVGLVGHLVKDLGTPCEGSSNLYCLNRPQQVLLKEEVEKGMDMTAQTNTHNTVVHVTSKSWHQSGEIPLGKGYN